MNRLLVVEDHPVVLQMLCGALRRRGAHIESATTLRSARARILEDDPYDAVICEHHLSDGSGLELLGWLRWQQHIPVPFLLVARYRNATFGGLTAADIITPPLGPDRLLARLNSLLQQETGGVLACQIPFAADLE